MSGSREESAPGDVAGSGEIDGSAEAGRLPEGSGSAEVPRSGSVQLPRSGSGSSDVARSPEAVVGIVGAGTMGAGIAQVAALAGAEVYVHDVAADRLAAAAESVRHRLRRLADTGRIPDADAVLARIRFCDGVSALASATLVIEAAVE